MILTKEQEHDYVIDASANTFTEFISKGYRVSTNPGSEKNFGFERVNLWPDILVWLPDSASSRGGMVKIIEEIETDVTVNSEHAKQWHDYANLRIDLFRLIVPSTSTFAASEIIRNERIKVQELWYYIIDSNGVKFYQSKYNIDW